MRSLEEQIARKCVHFTGISEKVCKCGIKYESVRDSSVSPYKWPCFKDDGAQTVCDKALFPTAAEVAECVAEIKKNTTQTLEAMAAVHEAARRLGLKKGRGGTGTIKCPVCTTGTLGFSVASYNGHIWGKCSTDNCVGWMQ